MRGPLFAGRRAVSLMTALVAGVPADAQLTIRISVPEGTPPDAEVYAAGTFNGWNPADPAYRLAEQAGEYVITLPEDVRGRVEFKFTLGSWDSVETDAAGGDVENRAFSIPAGGAATYIASVAGWRDPSKPRPRPAPTATPSVSILTDSFPMPQLGRTRRVWIYLPPDYATSGERYPVLYMHDGQNVFDASTSFAGEWGVDETLDSLHARGDRGVIVVAVDNGGQRRLDEYSPWRNPRHGGGEGDAYADFLANTLKPYVDRHYRTRPDRLNTGVAGSSMGGLISLYAALKYPDVFGRAGVFSPAFWFAADSMFAFVRDAAPPRRGTRFYFVTGAQEGDEPEVYVRDHRAMVDSLAARGFDHTHVQSHVVEDGRHSEWFWRREFPAVYRWLFAN